MILKGEAVILRAIEEDDCALLMELINDPDTEKMVLGWSFPVSKREQLLWIQNQKHDFKTERYIVEYCGEAVGMASLSNLDFKNSTANLNIKLLNSAHGKGIGTIAVDMLIHYCFDELNLHCLTATILAYNTASQRLFEKSGFQKEGVLRSRIYKNGKYHDVYSFSLLRGELNGNRQ